MAKRKQGPGYQSCYLHEVQDPNEEAYDPARHGICPVCAVKLWELGRAGLGFEMRGDRVSMNATGPDRGRTVMLSTGYQVKLDEAEGLEHLFNAVFGEVLSRMKGTPEFAARGFSLLFDLCICELHFVAGQLVAIGSSITTEFLLDEFGVHWDRLAERVNQHDADEEGTQPDKDG